jgi:2,4-dichlorophenol 6-monooxygenase
MPIPGADTAEVPVLIAGAGPAGLALSVALPRYGAGHLLVERHRGTARTPRAHIINQRTAAILRHPGISDRVHAVATPQHLMASNLRVTTLAGLEVARPETWGTSAGRAAGYRLASPEPMANCPQTALEPMLLAAARDTGADIRFGWEFTHLAQDQDGVTSVVRQRDGDATLTVRSRYVAGADGARSRVPGQAGLTAEGPDDLARAANIWFRADLSRYLARRPGVLTWNVMPGPLPPLRLGTLICHKPRRATPSCTTSRPPAPAPASRTPGSNTTASRSPPSTPSTTWASPCSPARAARPGQTRRRKPPHAPGYPSASMSSAAGKA